MLVLCYLSLVSPTVEWQQHQQRQTGRIQPAAEYTGRFGLALNIAASHTLGTDQLSEKKLPKEQLRSNSVICNHIQSPHAQAGSAGGYLENNANCFTF